MNLYAIALFLHITGALGLFLGLGMEGLVLKHLGSSTTNRQVLAWRSSMKLMRIIFAVAAILLLIPGLYLVGESWRFTPWVVVGIILLFALAGYGSVTGKKIGLIINSIINNNEPLPEEMRKKLSDQFLLKTYKIRFLVTSGIIYIMTLKTGWIGTIAVIVVAFVIGLLISLPKAEKVKELESA
jgi:hypothetical protein